MPKRYTPVTAAAGPGESAAPSRRTVEAGDLVPPVRGKDHAILRPGTSHTSHHAKDAWAAVEGNGG